MIDDRANRYHGKYVCHPLEQCRAITCELEYSIYKTVPSTLDSSAYSSAPAELLRPHEGTRGGLRREEGDYERDYSC